MNQPIRCQPLPFLKTNGEAAAGAAPRTEGNPPERAAFGELLNAELNDGEVESENSDEHATEGDEAVAAYGLALLLVPPVSPQDSKLISEGLAEDPGAEAPESIAAETAPLISEHQPAPEGPTDEPAARQEVQVEASVEPQVPLSELFARGRPILSPPEQKVPTLSGQTHATVEQISGKGPEQAKNSNGMVAAQPPSMLTTSQSHDERALPAEQRPGMERFEVASFEQPTQIRPLTTRPVRTAERISANDFVGPAPELPPAPRLELVSGDVDVQPVRPVEPMTVVEAVRTHIELLKASTTEKLDVVLRPDSRTELHLQVEKVNGVIQVQARCDRGDFSLLEAHWGTVQNTLATQGVRVEALQQGNGTQSQQNGSQHFQNFSGQNQREERAPASIEQDFPNREVLRSKTSRTSPVRGWQSWA